MQQIVGSICYKLLIYNISNKSSAGFDLHYKLLFIKQRNVEGECNTPKQQVA